jgi:16S rRNA processing protein RimM
MDKSSCYRVGRIVKSFGYKGSLILLFEREDAHTYTALPCIFVEIEGELVPFFFEDYQVRDDQTAMVRFDDIVAEDQARKLVNNDLYLPLEQEPEHDHSQSLQSWIEGYRVFDLEKGYIGTVREFLRLKEQDLLRVDGPGNEILIPAVEAFIERIDHRNREIHLDLPAGLLDLNP